MSHNNVSKRSSSVAQEDLKAKPPLTGSFKFLTPPRGDESMLEVCADIIADARAGLNGIDADELIAMCRICDEHGRDVKLFQEKKPGAKVSRLLVALVAVLALYTAELNGESPYGGCNGALRSANRAKCKPYIKFIWFLMHAMALCEPYSGSQVFRGVKADLSAEYPKDREVTWFQFSSCTCDIEVEQSEQFLGSTGTRTLFSIELTTGRARIISMFSLVPSEAEVLLPPNSRFKVLGQLDAGNGLVIIQLKELPSHDPIIDFDVPVAPAPAVAPAPSPTVTPASAGGGGAASAGDDVEEELQELVSEMVKLKLGFKKACVAFARSLADEGFMSLEELRPYTSAKARAFLEKSGMKEVQIDKVVAAFNPPTAAPAPAPAPATAKAAAAAFIAGKPDIFKAAESGDISLVGHHLTAEPSCVNAKDSDGATALMWSAWYGHLEVCKLLVSSKCDVNSSGQDRQTALMYSALNGHLEVCKLLVSSKADLAARNSNGDTALKWAMAGNKSDVVAFLRSIGAPQ